MGAAGKLLLDPIALGSRPPGTPDDDQFAVEHAGSVIGTRLRRGGGQTPMKSLVAGGSASGKQQESETQAAGTKGTHNQLFLPKSPL
jgi:hypothetical protein